MKKYKTIIGIEVHAELNTQTKAFCGCRNEFGAIPNTLTCPVCMGLPGAVPSINRKAIELTIATGILLGAEISNYASFERKNFFYPDMPKGYQWVQYSNPLCLGGKVRLSDGRVIALNRIHLEEDAARTVHDRSNGDLLIDFNRSGIPVVEIVSDPTEMTGEEVVDFLNNLKRTLIFGGISKCRTDKGGYRFDINISVKEDSSVALGTRVELKNLNSSEDVKNAIEYEKLRQSVILEKGDKVAQETRVWSEEFNRTYLSRNKENVSDYRHIVDPDLKTIEVTDQDIIRIKNSLPESYESRVNRYLGLGLNRTQIDTITSEKCISDYFDEAISIINAPREVAGWVINEIMHVYKNQLRTGFDTIISPINLKTIIELIDSRQISKTNAKVLFDEVVGTGKSADTLAMELELIGKVSDSEIADFVDEMLEDNMDIISDFHNNPDKVMNYFVGKVKIMTGGRVSAEKVQSLTINRLNRK